MVGIGGMVGEQAKSTHKKGAVTGILTAIQILARATEVPIRTLKSTVIRGGNWLSSLVQQKMS